MLHQSGAQLMRTPTARSSTTVQYVAVVRARVGEQGRAAARAPAPTVLLLYFYYYYYY